eukprot:c46330_g1_i1 orf=1-159(-)
MNVPSQALMFIAQNIKVSAGFRGAGGTISNPTEPYTVLQPSLLQLTPDFSDLH